jgi:hypothetical protein
MPSYSGVTQPWASYLDRITSIVIESGVTKISYYAFAQCKNLTTVTIGSDVTAINNYAFQNCSSLNTLIVAGSPSSVDGAAFSGCNVKKLIVAEGVTKVVANTILCKSSLEEIIISSNANIGGPTTAAAMAIAKGWNALIVPAILVGTLGYVLGNYYGIFAGTMIGL